MACRRVDSVGKGERTKVAFSDWTSISIQADWQCYEPANGGKYPCGYLPLFFMAVSGLPVVAQVQTETSLPIWPG